MRTESYQLGPFIANDALLLHFSSSPLFLPENNQFRAFPSGCSSPVRSTGQGGNFFGGHTQMPSLKRNYPPLVRNASRVRFLLAARKLPKPSWCARDR
jgi:hypothetical protein